MAEQKETTVRFDVEAEYAPSVRELLALLRRTTAGLAAQHRKNTFTRKGSRWLIVYSGSEFSVRDRVGMSYIAALLAKPGVPIAAINLATPGRSSAEARMARLFDPILDDQARQEYRARLHEIDEELACTIDDDDTERRASLCADKEVIEDQLRVSTGLGGRRRGFRDDHEQARLRVTKATSRAIEEIGKLSPDLANHLRLSITKGADCMYHPSEKITWKL